jgi:nuclear GTP-binding protein
MDVDNDENQNDGQGFDGIMSLRSVPSVPPPKKSAEPVQLEPAVPVTAGPNTLREVLQKADVLLHVVDARDPAAGISEALFKEATGKDILLLVNKIGEFFVLSALGIEPIAALLDTVPRESLEQWLSHLRLTYNTLPFRVAETFLSSKPNPPPASKSKKISLKLDDALGSDAVWQQLSALKAKKSGKELIVALTGVTNVSLLD